MSQTYRKGPEPVEVPEEQSLTTRLWERAATAGGRAIVHRPQGRGWTGLTWHELGEQVRGVAAGLLAVGIAPGDRVALMSPTRLEWTVADLAILSIGGVTVPIYETSAVEQCACVLADSGAKLAIAGSAGQARQLEAARPQAPALGEIVVIDNAGLAALAERASAGHRERVAEQAAAVRGGDLASIVYTSGTTGVPRGCLLTHHNLLWTARQAEVILRSILAPGDSTLMFLPLAHVFARLVQFLALEAELPMAYARSLGAVSQDLQSFRPTFLLSVPRVFERVFNGAQRKAKGPKRRVFDMAVRTALAYSSTVRPGPILRLRHGIADRLVYGKLRAALGGRMSTCVSGGASLRPELGHFFRATGITVLEGYGLTETSAPATVNTPQALKIGTVGRPLPGVEVRIAEDGEIQVRGPSVFAGYHGDEGATREVLSADGWLSTGDLGELDDQGFLRVTGRKKEIIVTAGGKNVAPAVLEERLKAHRLVSQAMVVGDNRPYVGALITLDPEELAAFSKEHRLTENGDALLRSDVLRREIRKAVNHANAAVSKAEGIRRFRLLERDFSEDSGELTPTMKIRRHLIVERFATEIEELYRR
jgi:long-chain acyl-CoA synthetase